MKLYVISSLIIIFGLCMLSSYTKFSWGATVCISALITGILFFSAIENK